MRTARVRDMNNTSTMTGRYVWAIYFVGDFDDAGDQDARRSSHIEPFVGKERVQTTSDPEQAWRDVRLSVLARGGKLLTITGDDQRLAEEMRATAESEMLHRK